MIEVHLGGAPVGDLVGRAVPREQGIALLRFEDRQRQSTGGAVHPLPGDLPAPAHRCLAHGGYVCERFALEEALTHIRNGALHLGLVLRVTNAGRIGDEPTALRILQEAAGEPGMQRVGTRHRGRAVVDDQVAGNTAEECPRRLQPCDHVLQLLGVGRPDEAVPRMAQHHHQGPDRAAATALLVHDEAQTPEVHLRHLPRCARLHPNRPRGALPPATANQVAQQGRIRHPDTTRAQQLLDARQLQTLSLQPPVYLVRPWVQQLLSRRRWMTRARLADRRQSAQLLLHRARAVT